METDFSTMVARKRLIQDGNGDLSTLGIYLEIYDKYITDEDLSHVFDTDFTTYWSNRCDEINPKIVPKLYN